MSTVDGWPRIDFCRLATVTHGWPFRSDHFTEPTGTLPIVVSIGNFRYSGGFRFESSTTKAYAGDYPPEFELNQGDLMLVMTCQTAGGEILGVPALVPDDGVTYLHNQRIGKVVVHRDDLLSVDFLYQFARTADFNRQLFVTSTGSKILHTSPKRIASANIPLPPMAEQKAIAEVLGALDDKIAANTQLNQTLVAHMDASLDGAVRRAARPVQVQVNDVAEFHNRHRVPMSANERAARRGTIPYYGASGVFGYVDEHLFNRPLVLVGEDGSVVQPSGQPVVQYVWGPAWVNNHAHVLTGSTISTELLRSMMLRSSVAAIVTGAVQPKLSMGNLKSLLIDVPGDSELPLLEATFATDSALLRAKTEETRSLIATRDTLLPLLMSGKLRVRNAERTVEEVV